MSIVIKDGEITVSAAYSLKVPLADVAFASQDAHVSFTVKGLVDTDDEQVLFKRAQELRADLDAQAKLAVFGALGVDFKEADIGVLVPDLSGFTPAAKPATAGGKKQGGYGNRNSGGGGFGGGGSTASRGGGGSDAGDKYRNLPRYDVTLPDGRKVTIQDQRSLKEADSISAKAPDFKVDERNGQGFWLHQQDGTPNDDVTDWLADQGVNW